MRVWSISKKYINLKFNKDVIEFIKSSDSDITLELPIDWKGNDGRVSKRIINMQDDEYIYIYM